MANTSSALNIDHRDGQLEFRDLCRTDHCSNQQDLLPERLWVKPRAKSLPSLIVNRHVSTMTRLPFFSQDAAHNVVHLDGTRIVPIVLVEVDLSLMRCSPSFFLIAASTAAWKSVVVVTFAEVRAPLPRNRTVSTTPFFFLAHMNHR